MAGEEPGMSRVDLLMRLYAAERSDYQQGVTSMITVLLATTAVVVLVGTAFAAHDRLRWAVLFVPVVPLPLIAYAAIITCLANVRGYVIERYEREIRFEVARSSDSLLRGLPAVPFGHSAVRRMWREWWVRCAIILAFIALTVMYAVVLVISAVYAWGATSHWLTISVATLCSVALAFCLVVFFYVSWGKVPRIVQEVVGQLAAELKWGRAVKPVTKVGWREKTARLVFLIVGAGAAACVVGFATIQVITGRDRDDHSAELARSVGAHGCNLTGYRIVSNLTGDKTDLYRCSIGGRRRCITYENGVAQDETDRARRLFRNTLGTSRPACI
jgi:hypothetical protein